MKRMDKDIVDLLSGDTIVYDENGNRVPLSKVPPCNIINETNITLKELMEAFGEPLSFIKKVFES